MGRTYHNDIGKIVFYDPDQVMWDDIRVPVTSTTKGGTKDPTFEVFRKDLAGTSQGVFAYSFSDSAENELYFTIQIPHGYKLKTDLNPHIHWSTSATITGTVQWGLEYTMANINATLPVTEMLNATHAIASNEQYKHQYTDLGDIDGSGIDSISTMLLCRIFRNVATPDDFAATVQLLEIDFHYQMDTRGSLKENSKW